MARSRKARWARRSILIGAAGAGALAGLRARRARRRAMARELSDTITITRGRYGVPHISAATRNDALFGLGYAVAEDRLWQMDLYRRIALGRLSEIVGPQGLESDRLMRLIGMPRIVHQLVASMTEREFTAAEAFAAGVNHRIETGPLPVEFRISRYHPEPWTPADSMAVFRLLAWSLSGSHDIDLLAERLRRAIGDEWTDAIFTGSHATDQPVVRQQAQSAARMPEPAQPLQMFPRWGASNAWAVSAERSATGAPLLANDPHLELRNPSIWCEASLEAPGLHVAGVTLPGMPGIVIGRTPTLAWGATAAMTPQTFLYREVLSEDGAQVYVDGEWQPLRTHDEVIVVRGQPDEILRIRYTPRGPLITDLMPDAEDTASFYWTGMEEGHELDAILGANGAASIAEIRPELEKFATPPLNVAAADAEGNIALLSIGRLPVREPRTGLLDPSAFPPRYVAADDMPVEMNPDRGWVACANNRIIGDDYPHQLYGLWAPPFRCQRITAVLESRHKHSPGDFRTLQIDTRSLHAESVVPHLLDLIDGAVPDWAVRDLREWNYDTPPESRPTLLFEVFHREWTQLALAHRLPDDLVHDLTVQLGALSAPVLFVDRLLRGELPGWLDDESRRTLAVRAFQQALAWIAERLGPDRERWAWGAVHTLTFEHPFGMIPGPHRMRFNAGPYPVAGDRFTVAPMYWHPARPFEVVAGPSMRFVADLRRPGEDWITNTLGQSESALSRHFQDQLEDYLKGFAHRAWPDTSTPESRTIIRPDPETRERLQPSASATA